MKPRIYKRAGLWFCEWPSTPHRGDLPAVGHATWAGALSDARIWVTRNHIAWWRHR